VLAIVPDLKLVGRLEANPGIMDIGADARCVRFMLSGLAERGVVYRETVEWIKPVRRLPLSRRSLRAPIFVALRGY